MFAALWILAAAVILVVVFYNLRKGYQNSFDFLIFRNNIFKQSKFVSDRTITM